MSRLYVEVEVLGGTDIKVAASEACALANRIGIGVRFEFNEVSCHASPGGEPEALVSNFHEALNSKGRFKMAFSR
jgi:hypothetical protein